MPSSENAEDYEWLWQEWIKATGCAPRVLFSDAAYALLGSVPRVFPPDRTAHFLCLFHIYKNLTENCRNSLEQHDFTALESAIRQVQECPDKDAADILWRKILEDPRWKTVKDYLGVRSPLHRLDRWCVAWQVEVFTFGCKSTQRAESSNCRMKRHLTARKGYYHIFLSVLHLLSKEGYKLEYTEMVNHRHANHQIASTAYLVYEYDVSREAQYIVANRAAPLWNYDRQCHDSLETELVDLPRFCAISNRVHQIQGKNIVYEVKRSESSCTSHYMNCPHYVCLFEPLAEGGAYTKFSCSCGLAVRVGHPCRHYFAVLHHRSSSVGFHLGLFNPIFILKQFQTATEVLISAKCSSQRLPLPTVQVPVAIHATDDDIILTDISSS